MNLKILLVSSLIFCCIFDLSAQLGANIQTPLNSFCSPGVDNKSRSRGIELSYQMSSVGRWNGVGSGINSYSLNGIESLTFKLKAPLLLKPDLKILAGYSYQPEEIGMGTSMGSNFPVLLPLNDTRLKSHGLALYAIKSINARNYMALRFKLTSSGDYDGFLNFDRAFVSYSAIAAYGIKPHKDLEYGFGLSFSKNPRRTMVLPFLFYNKNFNDKLGLEATIPTDINLRWNMNKETNLLVGYNLSSSSYGVNLATDLSFAEQTNTFVLRHSELQAGFSLERQIVPWVWVNFKGGYQFNLNTRLHSMVPGVEDFRYRPDNGMYFRVGFFISPQR
jgi:hypothetical protein